MSMVEGWWTPLPVHPPQNFLHTAELGQKGMEQVICQDHQEGTPGLDPRVDVPAIQLMGYKTSQGEIRELYNEVY